MTISDGGSKKHWNVIITIIMIQLITLLRILCTKSDASDIININTHIYIHILNVDPFTNITDTYEKCIIS